MFMGTFSPLGAHLFLLPALCRVGPGRLRKSGWRDTTSQGREAARGAGPPLWRVEAATQPTVFSSGCTSQASSLPIISSISQLCALHSQEKLLF